MSEASVIKLAAILYRPSEGPAIDSLLARVTHVLREKGLALAGVIQWNAPAASGPCSDMTLEDLHSGRRVIVSEDRGPLAKGCRLDSGALEEVAGLTRSSIRPGIDLLVVNKFSKSEAEGAGLRQAIEAAVLAGVPVLAGLNVTHRAAWEAFAGGESAYLPCDADAIVQWCLGARPSQRAAEA